MQSEICPIPNYERAIDIAWLTENIEAFRVAAIEAVAQDGRGVFSVDLITLPEAGKGNRFTYWPQAYVDLHAADAVCDLVAAYDLNSEIVVMLLKPHDRISAYRIGLNVSDKLDL